MASWYLLIIISAVLKPGATFDCYECRLPAEVDLGQLSMEELDKLLAASSCSVGGYAAGDDEMVSCKDEMVIANVSGQMLFSVVSNNIGVHSNLNVDRSIISDNAMRWNFFGNSRYSSDGQCLWVRKHRDCADADLEDEDTVCQCRDQCSRGDRPGAGAILYAVVAAVVFYRE